MSTIIEILTDAQKDIRVLAKQYQGHNYLRNILEAAFLPQKKLLLPSGSPPFRPLNASPYQMKGAFWQVARKIDIFMRPELSALKRESTFIQSLESMPRDEAEILILVKDQKLHEMFPIMTYENVVAAGYIIGKKEGAVQEQVNVQKIEPPKAEEIKKDVEQPIKRKPGRPFGSKNPPRVPKTIPDSNN